MRECREQQLGHADGVEDEKGDHGEAARHGQQELDLEQGRDGMFHESPFGQQGPNPHREHVQPDGDAVPQHRVTQKRGERLAQQKLVGDTAKRQNEREGVDHRSTI